MKKLIILMAIMSMFIIGVVSAQSLTLETTTWGQDGFVNITLGTPEDCGNTATPYCGNATEFVTLYATCSDTANNTQSLLYNITNSSTTDDSTNFNWGYANFTLGDDLVLEDSIICSVTRITTGLGDADAITLASTTVLVDRTIPTAPTTTQAAQSILKSGDVITYTVTGTDTTSCRIAFLTDGAAPRSTGSGTFAMVHSGNSCTYTIAVAAVPDGAYNVYGFATDGTNSPFSSKLNLEIDDIISNTQPIEAVLSVYIGRKVVENQKRNQFFLIALFVVVVYLATRKK